MRSLLKRVFRRKLADPGASAEVDPHPTSVEAGQIYSFQTKPHTEFSPPTTCRFAALKILGVNNDYIVVAVLDGIWSTPPASMEVETSSILHEHRLAHTGKPAIFGVIRELWTPVNDLEEFKCAGMQPVSPWERSFYGAIVCHAPGSRTSTLSAANYAAEGEWRWENDREELIAEVNKKKAKNEAARAVKEERNRTRLSKLTWEQLQSETLFERWSPSPPFPPEEFTNAARALISGACNSLKELGSKPRRADVRAILKETVIGLNRADAEAGGVIETEEREDICAVLEEMAYVARQKVLADEIDEWREW